MARRIHTEQYRANVNNQQISPIHIIRGLVVDVISGPRWYSVRIGTNPPIPCAAGVSDSAHQPVGPKPIGMYAVGTWVLVAVPTASGSLYPPGYILCSIPPIVSRRMNIPADTIAPINGADAMNDPTHAFLPQEESINYHDFNAGVPLDAIPGSDQGVINELGVGHGISRFFSWMRASELAGVWCFYLDNLVRIAAHNYEFWSAGGERWIKNDEGEINDIELFTPYPWEAKGKLRLGDAPFEQQTGGGYVQEEQFKLQYEPNYPDQTLLPRWMRVRGYLGDAHREMVVLPIPKVTDAEVGDFSERLSNKTDYTGVLDIHQHSSGLYSVRSAQGIIHEKYIFIPVPKQMAVPEERDRTDNTPATAAGGDGSTNYAAAGVDLGIYTDAQLEAHTKNPWPWTNLGKGGQMSRSDMWAAEFYDFNAYMFNWYGLKTILAHVNDWYVVDSGFFANLPRDQGSYDKSPFGIYILESPNTMDKSFMYNLPAYASLNIDHRESETKYYYSRSVIAQLPDGSILIEDGYGSSIHMAGGSIFMSGPGDVWIKPGRSIVMWAGDDLVARAGSSVDITSSNCDVRIKAEHALHMLGGNSGIEGGVIIESRSVYGIGGSFQFRDDGDDPLVGEDVWTYGIILKAPNAPIMMYGRDIYGKAVAYNEEGGDNIGGNVEFEADYGLITSGSTQIHYAKNGMTHILGQQLSEGGAVLSTSVVNRFDVNDTVLGSKLLFRAAADVVIFDSTGGMFARGPFAVSGGIVPFPSESVESVIAAYSEDYTAWLTGSGQYDLPTVMTFYYNDMYEMDIKSDATFIEIAGFTCRNVEQYGMHDDFMLAEARWQQVARHIENNGECVLWNEPRVGIPGIDISSDQYTMPHPGSDNWDKYERYMEYESDLWQWLVTGTGSGDNPTWAVHDISRSPTENVDSAYRQAYQDRVDDASEAFKARFLSKNYLVSQQVQ